MEGADSSGDCDKLCPYRQKEVLTHWKEQLPRVAVNSHDLQSVNQVYRIYLNEDVCWKPAYEAYQYSAACIDRLVERPMEDKEFLARQGKRITKSP